jgi:hypothetical protein
VTKYFLCFCFLLVAASALAQKKSIVFLIKSESSTGIKVNGKDVIKVYQGTFKHDYSTLTSDSAYFYPGKNALDAFGHVVINQGDTVHIYSDLLNYDGNTKIAILTYNVKMVDKDATLTTNHFTYNTATRIGVYTEGGKLVNKDNTLLSKNGYYFAFTRDSYFRYNVSLTSPDALVLTDTMRYNTGTRISYFYGPTNIYGTKGKKDQDTLYTENGQYNTKIETGAFGKNNLYHSGSRSLKGDSLFYDKLKGYGRAVMHVTFEDKEQKTTIKGNLGTYFKDGEHTIVTEDPYVMMVTEKDSTQHDSTAKADSAGKVRKTEKAVMNMGQLIKKTIPGKTDAVTTAQKNSIIQAAVANKGNIPVAMDVLSMAQKSAIMQTVAANKGIIPDIGDTLSTAQKKAIIKTVMANKGAIPGMPDSLSAAQKKLIFKTVLANKGAISGLTDTLSAAQRTAIMLAADKAMQMAKTDSVIKKPEVRRVFNNKVKTTALNKAKAVVTKKVVDSLAANIADKPLIKDTSKSKTDTIYMSADTIETRVMTYKDLKVYFEAQRKAHMLDTGKKIKKVNLPDSKFLVGYHVGLPKDTDYLQPNKFGKPKIKVVKKKPPTKKQLLLDSLQKKAVADSLVAAKAAEPSDTARIRILIGYHNFKMFKSDLQAKSDSMFYSGSDSTIRCFVNPIMWTEGSQLSGDTIYLQMKHRKLDNMKMFPHAFIVNIEKTDSVHFNQVGGKRMRGYFKNDKLYHMIIEGNAESIYFARDSGKMTVNGMQRSLSSSIGVYFKDNKVTHMTFFTKPDNRYGPLAKFTADDKVLKGFIWKPKDRPISKESIIPSYNKKKKAAEDAKKAASDKLAKGKQALKNLKGATPAAKDTTAAPGKLPLLKTGQDSAAKKDTIKMAAPKLHPDTSKIKAPVLPPAPVKN